MNGYDGLLVGDGGLIASFQFVRDDSAVAGL
jgi:hypothetical protein